MRIKSRIIRNPVCYLINCHSFDRGLKVCLLTARGYRKELLRGMKREGSEIKGHNRRKRVIMSFAELRGIKIMEIR